MKKYVFVLLIFFSINSSAQDISGLWKGKYYWKDVTSDTITVYFEINQRANPNKFSGITVCINDNPGKNYWYGKSSLMGFYNNKTRKYKFDEMDMLECSFSSFLDKYILSYNEETGELTGEVKCTFNGPNYACTGTRIIELSRTNEYAPAMREVF